MTDLASLTGTSTLVAKVKSIDTTVNEASTGLVDVVMGLANLTGTSTLVTKVDSLATQLSTARGSWVSPSDSNLFSNYGGFYQGARYHWFKPANKVFFEGLIYVKSATCASADKKFHTLFQLSDPLYHPPLHVTFATHSLKNVAYTDTDGIGVVFGVTILRVTQGGQVQVLCTDTSFHVSLSGLHSSINFV